jgi:hypothetical protein
MQTTIQIYVDSRLIAKQTILQMILLIFVLQFAQFHNQHSDSLLLVGVLNRV